MIEAALLVLVLLNVAALAVGLALYTKISRVDGIMQVLGRRAPDLWQDIQSIRHDLRFRRSGSSVR